MKYLIGWYKKQPRSAIIGFWGLIIAAVITVVGYIVVSLFSNGTGSQKQTATNVSGSVTQTQIMGSQINYKDGVSDSTSSISDITALEQVDQQEIQAMNPSVSELAKGFAATLPEKQSALAKSKAQEDQQNRALVSNSEITFSQEALPMFIYAMTFIEDYVKTYAGQVNITPTVHQSQLPLNLFSTTTITSISFSNNSVWQISISGYSSNYPSNLYLNLGVSSISPHNFSTTTKSFQNHLAEPFLVFDQIGTSTVSIRCAAGIHDAVATTTHSSEQNVFSQELAICIENQISNHGI